MNTDAVETLEDKLQEFYELKNLTRYNQRVRIKDESVAEHSYFVSLFTLLLCRKLKVGTKTTQDSLAYALIHDIPEIEISDIPHPVKSLNALRKIVGRLERDALEMILPDFLQLYENCESGQDEKVKTIVDLADVLSVIQYVSLEQKLGNTTLSDIEEQSYDRYQDLLEKVEKIFKVELDWSWIL